MALLFSNIPRIQQGCLMARLAVVVVSMLSVSITEAADLARDPMTILKCLADHIYVP